MQDKGKVPIQNGTNSIKTMHKFPRVKGTRPQIGDVAFCGWVKQNPTPFRTQREAMAAIGKTHEWCVVCLEMSGGSKA